MLAKETMVDGYAPGRHPRSLSKVDICQVSIVMPCLNEVEAIGVCIETALTFLSCYSLRGEIIVVDNGSTDGSTETVRAKPVSLICEPSRGYGSAYISGLAMARGSVIILADSDGTYDLHEAAQFLELIEEGFDLVVGSRLHGRIAPGAMPWTHRWLGIPILTWLLNQVTGYNISDAHCGLRAIKHEALQKLELRAKGMEFASEMMLQAARRGLTVNETPVTYHRREGQSKLRPVRDGLRHLAIILRYAVQYRAKWFPR